MAGAEASVPVADPAEGCRLAGKVALITGAGSGIGRATALLFARAGAAVSLLDLNRAAVREAAETIARQGGRALPLAGDVTRDQDCRRAVRETVSALGGLHVVFNNAGIIRRATVTETEEQDWDRIMATNVKSVFLMSRAAIPALRGAGGGVIINNASGWGLQGGPRAAAYCASKGAVVLLTKAMAIDHGPDGIRVNCLCPGDTRTPLLEREAHELGQSLETFLAGAANRPLGRPGRPEDVAQAALYLASEASSFVTGTVLVVDGGGLAG